MIVRTLFSGISARRGGHSTAIEKIVPFFGALEVGRLLLSTSLEQLDIPPVLSCITAASRTAYSFNRQPRLLLALEHVLWLQFGQAQDASEALLDSMLSSAARRSSTRPGRPSAPTRLTLRHQPYVCSTLEWLACTGAAGTAATAAYAPSSHQHHRERCWLLTRGQVPEGDSDIPDVACSG